MVSDNSTANDFGLARIKDGGSANEVNARVVNTLIDVHRLLEPYAPSWYTEELHKKIMPRCRASDRSLSGYRVPRFVRYALSFPLAQMIPFRGTD